MRKWILLIATVFTLSGCLETEVTLTGTDYKLIDSFYTKEKDSLTPLLEQECTDFQDSVLQIWIDSIMTERRIEIEKLINR